VVYSPRSAGGDACEIWQMKKLITNIMVLFKVVNFILIISL
jgi:hypothetical protein